MTWASMPKDEEDALGRSVYFCICLVVEDRARRGTGAGLDESKSTSEFFTSVLEVDRVDCNVD
jgi:hypothetical protein